MPLQFKKIYFISLVLLLLTLLMAQEIFQHFNPGAMSFDSFSILAQARSGIYSDGHPPLMALIWSFADAVVPGPLLILLLNLFFYYGGLLLIFIWAAKHYGFLCAPLLIIVGLYPPLTAILGAIWIDITMAAFFISGLGIFLVLVADHTVDSLIKKSALILSVFLIASGVSMRHNAAAAAVPLFVFITYQIFFSSKKPFSRFIYSVLTGFLLTIICFVVVKQLQNGMTDVKAEHWRVSASYDIAGTSFYHGKYLFDASVIRDNKTVGIQELYSPRSVIPLFMGQQIHALPGEAVRVGVGIDFDTDNPSLNSDLFQNWIRVIVSHPRSYIHHRYEVSKSLITRSPWGLWSTVYDWTIPNDMGVPPRTVTDSEYFKFVRESSFKSIFVPIYYLLASMLLFLPVIYFAVKLNSTPLLLIGLLYLSGVLHMFGLFFFAASGDSRYSHWMIFTTVLASAILFAELSMRLSRAFLSGSRWK